MEINKRHRTITAIADSYYFICPYKDCGHQNPINSASKDEIVRCGNCRKELKISKVVCR
jgi:predicted SprT family Zn-dependent metalloprotease